MDILTEAVVKESVRLIIAGMAKRLSGLFPSTRFRPWRSKEVESQVAATCADIQMVKTIWTGDSPIDFRTFYVEPDLRYQGVIFTPRTADDLRRRDHLNRQLGALIVGVAGQGKSTLLKQLYLNALQNEKKLPVLIELRNLREREIVDLVLDEVTRLKMTSDREVAGELLRDGHVVILADGFDEIRGNERVYIADQLELHVKRYPNSMVVVSSRPNGGLEYSAMFSRFKMEYFSRAKAIYAARRIGNDELADRIARESEVDGNNLADVLRTPLLIALLFVTYRINNRLPRRWIAFFETVFLLVVNWHDATKSGYERERRSGLAPQRLEELFFRFAYTWRKESDASILNRNDVQRLARETIIAFEEECSVDDFLFDICQATNLLIESELKYEAIHLSILEFYAARFLKSSSDSDIGDFFVEMQTGRWKDWTQEIGFLREIDRDRFLNLFARPEVISIVKLLEDCGAPALQAKRLLSLYGAKAKLKQADTERSFKPHVEEGEDRVAVGGDYTCSFTPQYYALRLIEEQFQTTNSLDFKSTLDIAIRASLDLQPYFKSIGPPKSDITAPVLPLESIVPDSATAGDLSKLARQFLFCASGLLSSWNARPEKIEVNKRLFKFS